MNLSTWMELWRTLGGECPREVLDALTAMAKECRRQEARASRAKGRCVRCGWKGPATMTAVLEYELHLVEHQIEAILSHLRVETRLGGEPQAPAESTG